MELEIRLRKIQAMDTKAHFEWHKLIQYKIIWEAEHMITYYLQWHNYLAYLPIKSNALNNGKHLSLAISFMSDTLLPL